MKFIHKNIKQLLRKPPFKRTTPIVVTKAEEPKIAVEETVAEETVVEETPQVVEPQLFEEEQNETVEVPKKRRTRKKAEENNLTVNTEEDGHENED